MANETAFQPGDVVQLNSGGPLVTVQNVTTDGKYFTYYYIDKDGFIALRQNTVLAAAFRKVNSPTDENKSPNPEAGGAI